MILYSIIAISKSHKSNLCTLINNTYISQKKKKNFPQTQTNSQIPHTPTH